MFHTLGDRISLKYHFLFCGKEMLSRGAAWKRIYDPIHGFIPLTRLEVGILDSCYLQRLRRIKQLGPADYVYPSATHTRFAHSLGTMLLAGKIAMLTGLNDFEVKSVRLTGLLHDIGHMPFSHSIELVKHEKLGLAIIENYLADALGDHAEIVAKILSGEHRLSPIISSEIDADRIDYLVRDSYFTGLRYGLVDADRLVESLVLVEKAGRYGLAVREDAQAAVESLLIGRFQMFRRLYYHRTVGGFEAILSRFYEESVKEGAMPPPDEVLKGGGWCAFDDYSLVAEMRKLARENSYIGELARLFLTRRPLKLVVEAKLYLSGVSEKKHSFIVKLWRRGALLDELESLSNVPREWIFIHVPKMKLVKGDAPLFVIRDDGELVELDKLGEGILPRLYNLGYSPIRVYTKKEYAGELRRAVENIRGG